MAPAWPASYLALPYVAKPPGVPVRYRGAGNGQHGVGSAGDACAVKAPAFLCASFGFEGDMGGLA